jgi:hypothetical protein
MFHDDFVHKLHELVFAAAQIFIQALLNRFFLIRVGLGRWSGSRFSGTRSTASGDKSRSPDAVDSIVVAPVCEKPDSTFSPGALGVSWRLAHRRQ